MPIWLEAGLWSILGASSLLAGAATGYLMKLPRAVTAGIMAFGCGVLISAVAYDLLEDGYEDGGIWPVILGATIGSLAYALLDRAFSRAASGGGLAVLAGALIDGIPESVVLGVGMVAGEGVSLPILAAIFLSNFPEALASVEGMRRDGRGPGFVFGLWGVLVAASGLAAAAGAAAVAGASPQVLGFVNAVAAGGLLTMVVNSMIPEAVAGDKQATGVLVVAGLLLAFALTNLG
jgi:ZIP family zinc transporter